MAFGQSWDEIALLPAMKWSVASFLCAGVASGGDTPAAYVPEDAISTPVSEQEATRNRSRQAYERIVF
jgi:hypothetical protein